MVQVRLSMLEEREQLREKIIQLNARANQLLADKGQLQQERILAEEERCDRRSAYLREHDFCVCFDAINPAMTLGSRRTYYSMHAGQTCISMHAENVRHAHAPLHVCVACTYIPA
jgi:hypothetical protein